jgi:DNA-binding response OmpR family regulator
MALILIADDDELVVGMVREALEARGHIVGAVDDGLPVVGIVEFKRPALVILDCAMPELSGLDALRQIRNSQTCYSTPVLMLTGRRSDADENIAFRAGASDYLRKPFDPDQLVSRVEALLAREEAKWAPKPAPAAQFPAPPATRRWGER